MAFTLISTASIANSEFDRFPLNHQNKGDSIGKYVDYYLAPQQQKDIHDMINLPSELWQSSNQSVPSFSLVTGDIWLRIKLENQDHQRTKKILHLDYALLDYVEVFYSYGNSTDYSDHYRTGSIYSYSTRPIGDSAFAFPIHLGPSQEVTVYMRLQNDGFIQAPITVWDEVAFYENRLMSQSLLFAFIGILTALGIYNIFLFLSVNEKTYLLFALLAISTSALVSISSGVSIQYLGLDLKTWNERWMTVCLGIMTISGALLPIVALRLKYTLKPYYYICNTIALLGVWIILSAFILNHSTRIGAAFAITSVSIVLINILSIHLWIKKVPGVRLFTISWGLFLFGGAIMILNRLSILPRNDSTEYLLVYTSLTGLFLLSFSLANRINSAKLEQERAQTTSLKLMEKFYNLFQNSLEGIFTITTQGELIEANPALCNMLGYADIDELKSSVKSDKLFSDHDLKNIMKQIREEGEVRSYEVQGKRTDGSNFWAAVYLRTDQFNANGSEVFSGALLDITHSKESQLKLEYLADHDPLTGLYNRRKFMSSLSEAIKNYQNKNVDSSVIYIDLDQFKVVNDTCGHTAGDKLLKELTATMSDLIPLGSCLTRLGGDEFAIILSGYNEESSYQFAEHMRQTISNFQFPWGDLMFSLGASIGIISINDDCSSVEYVHSLADTACFAAKDQGRNSIHIYDHERGEAQALKSEMHRVSEINQALENGRFVLHQQLIVPTKTGAYSGYYEILVRMTNRANEIIPPGLFLPAAERYNLMPAIDQWVVENYCQWLIKHPEHLKELNRASINLSAASLNDVSAINFIINCFHENNIPPEKICFEVTESSAIINMDKSLPLLRRIRDEGFNLALDDFGSGFASYGYLKNLPFNVLKIDGCFIRDIANSHIDKTMVKSINDVAKALGMSTVAEFVENDTILEIINDIGVEFSQGYGIAKPLPLDSLINETIDL
ncbi:EAL domain-containing protein [Litoribacillus peritrichatus]